MASFDRRMVYHFDWSVFILALMLAGIGVLSVFSATWGNSRHGLDPLVMRQLMWIGIGAAMMTAASLFDYRSLSAWSYLFYALTVGLLGVVAVAGHSTGGSQRWINLGVLKLEPSEVAKLAVVLVMVRYLREEPPRGGWSLKHIVIPGLLLALPAGLVLKQPDLAQR